jgi:transposase
MQRAPLLGVDVPGQFCELAVVTAVGKLVQRDRGATPVPALRQGVGTVPRPRRRVIAAGPLAGWWGRTLHAAVEALGGSAPRRNRLRAKDGDQDDDREAAKLAQLARGGYVKAVHQVGSRGRAVCKQRVALYPHRVRQRVRAGRRLTSRCRQHGVMIRERDYTAAADRPALRERLPADGTLRAWVRALGSS